MSVFGSRLGNRADRVPLIRHAALCAGALLACLLREQLRVRDTLLWIIVAAAVLNLLASIGSNRKRPGPLMRATSTALGLAGWSLLATLTGGIASPFIAGLWLEIGLSGSAPPPAILLTTAGAVAGVWLQVTLQGLEGRAATPLLMTAFLIVSGGLTLRLAHRWRRSRGRMSRRMALLRRRLGHLEQELRSNRQPAGRDKEAAHLAHSLKNAVHSMRGFVRLLEPRLQSSAGCDELLSGLRSAINHLEDLSRVILSPADAPKRAAGGDRQAALATVREAVDQVAAAFPEVRWSVSAQDTPADVEASGALVRDALINVLRNAAEAMQGRGDVHVQAASIDGRLVIRIRDHGPGILRDVLEPGPHGGRTTKAGGHGLGLLLTRRILEAAGGRLTVSPAEGGGVVCALELPIPTPSATLAGAAGST